MLFLNLFLPIKFQCLHNFRFDFINCLILNSDNPIIVSLPLPELCPCILLHPQKYPSPDIGAPPEIRHPFILIDPLSLLHILIQLPKAVITELALSNFSHFLLLLLGSRCQSPDPLITPQLQFLFQM